MSRKMSDRHMDIGSGRKGSVFPEEVHTKKMMSPTGAGRIMDYPDTEEKVHRDQDKNISMAERQKMKPGFRH